MAVIVDRVTTMVWFHKSEIWKWFANKKWLDLGNA